MDSGRQRVRAARGFTLVELLAVIAIILILMSLLLPSFGLMKRSAERSQCGSNLRQLQASHVLFISDNKGSFMDYVIQTLFFDFLEPYHGFGKEIRVCPAAREPTPGVTRGSARTAYHWGDGSDGSYGINGFCYGVQTLNLPDGSVNGRGGKYNPQHEGPWANYRYDDMWFKSAGYIASPQNSPCFADAMWPDGWPIHQSFSYSSFNIQNPSQADGMYIRRFILDRHGRRCNIALMDGSVRTVPLNEMWKLKWNNLFELQEKHPAPELQPL